MATAWNPSRSASDLDGLHVVDDGVENAMYSVQPGCTPSLTHTDDAFQDRHVLVGPAPSIEDKKKILGLRRTSFWLVVSNILLVIALVVLGVVQSQISRTASSATPTTTPQPVILSLADCTATTTATTRITTTTSVATATETVTTTTTAATATVTVTSTTTTTTTAATATVTSTTTTTTTAAKATVTVTTTATTTATTIKNAAPAPDPSSGGVCFSTNRVPAGPPGTTSPECPSLGNTQYQVPGTSLTFTRMCNTDFPGNDMARFPTATMLDCLALCAQLNLFPTSAAGRCIGVSWLYSEGLQGTNLSYCYPKSATGNGEAKDNTESATLLS